LQRTLGFILIVMIFQEFTVSSKPIRGAIAFKVMHPVTFNVFICHFQARPTVSAEHFTIAPLSFLMLTKVSSKSQTNISSCLAAIAHVFKATSLGIYAFLEALSAVETYWCTRISSITLYISAAAVDASPPVITVNAVLPVDVELF
jgi:hypothetical protein